MRIGAREFGRCLWDLQLKLIGTQVENEMPWAERDVPKTMYEFIDRVAARHGARPGVSFQITSGQADKAETLSWQEFRDKSVQAANLFRRLGVVKMTSWLICCPSVTRRP